MYFYQGEKVELRKLRENDCKVLYEEQKDSEGIRLFEPGIQKLESEEFFIELIKRPYMFAIEDKDKNFVGTVHINSTDERNGIFDFGIRIFTKYRSKGYAKDAIRILLRLGFHELRYQKVNSEVVSFNQASISLHKSLGFIEEGRRRRSVYTNGEYYDDILFGMTKEEFDFLK